MQAMVQMCLERHGTSNSSDVTRSSGPSPSRRGRPPRPQNSCSSSATSRRFTPPRPPRMFASVPRTASVHTSKICSLKGSPDAYSKSLCEGIRLRRHGLLLRLARPGHSRRLTSLAPPIGRRLMCAFRHDCGSERRRNFPTSSPLLRRTRPPALRRRLSCLRAKKAERARRARRGATMSIVRGRRPFEQFYASAISRAW